MTVTVKDAQSGQLKIFPAGDATAGGATAVPFTAGTTATATVQETAGQSSKISFQNVSAGAATVTATITGYLPALTAGIIGETQCLVTGLPGGCTFTKKQDASDLLITISGSAFSTTANTKHGFHADVDGVGAGGSSLYFNNAFEHLAFPTAQFLMPAFFGVRAGPHKLNMTTDAATDSNDLESLMIVEVMREG
jgi:hypothetical protein